MARKKHKRPHGTGSYTFRDGRHVVQWTENGKRRTKSLPTEDEARQYLKEACAGLKKVQTVCTDNLGALAETWLAGRAEMASNYDDRNRWKNHLGPIFGTLKPGAVGVSELKTAIVVLRGKGLSRATVGLCMRVLSSLYGDLVEDGVAQFNPVRLLSDKTRAKLKSEWDPKKTPFVKDPADITRIYRWLRDHNESVAMAYAVGALGGLRTNEVRALSWDHVDLGRRLIHVQVQVARRGGGVTTLKDDDSRLVPISDSLFAILENYHPRVGLVCLPTREGFLRAHLMGQLLAQALAELEIAPMIWYQATRHTFASQWVLHGGTLETLQDMMGHSSVVVTERYAHLIPGRFSDADRARVAIDLTSGSRENFVN